MIPPDSHLAISVLLGGLVTGGSVIYDTTVTVVILVVIFPVLTEVTISVDVLTAAIFAVVFVMAVLVVFGYALSPISFGVVVVLVVVVSIGLLWALIVLSMLLSS